MNKINNIDQYITAFPDHVQKILKQLRDTIKQAAPTAAESINYQIPTFKLKGNLVHFAAFQKHIGFYPTPSGISQFKTELSDFKCAKGSVQFPLDQPLPAGLIKRIVKFRVAENLKKAEPKRKH